MEKPTYPLEPLFGRVLSPLEHFLQRATAGGIVLIAVTLVALALATTLGGIGFTMSLFISQLAFSDAVHMEQAKLGILLASLIAALIGLAWLLMATRAAPTPPAAAHR